MTIDPARPATTWPVVVGRVLAAIRDLREMNQPELAAALGVTATTLARIEHGASALAIEQLALAADHLDTPPARIIEWAWDAQGKLVDSGITVFRARHLVTGNVVMIDDKGMTMLLAIENARPKSGW
jgi:transcriptional regulator with XRE-family HTH domain